MELISSELEERKAPAPLPVVVLVTVVNLRVGLSCFSGESLRAGFSFSGESFSLGVACFSLVGEILLAAVPGLLGLDPDFLLGARLTAGVTSRTTRGGLRDLTGEIRGELFHRIPRLGDLLLPSLPLGGVLDVRLLLLLEVLPTADLPTADLLR